MVENGSTVFSYVLYSIGFGFGHHKSYKCGGIFSFLFYFLLLQQRTDSVEIFDFTDPPIASKRKTQSRSQSEFDDEL